MWTGREWKKLLMESIYHRPKNLLIIADDLGLAESLNDGIFFLLKEGKINGASLMANGEAFDDAVAKYLEAGLLNIGVHLVLVEEKPLSGMSLPKNHKMFFIKYLFGLIKLSEIEKELRTQLQNVINAGDLNIKDLRLAKKLTKMYPEKVIELGCHPGFESQELVEKYGHWRYNWEKEVEVLKRKNDEDE